jgi:malonyl CoA-acyl carrier protein transacylase
MGAAFVFPGQGSQSVGMGKALADRFALEADLPPESDHPVSFAQADYLKILTWRAAR